MGTNPKSPDYFLPVFFLAAQYAFNFADNFARVAVLITVFWPRVWQKRSPVSNFEPLPILLFE